MSERPTREVFDDHLWHRRNDGVKPDLHNFATNAVIMTGYGVFRGHDGVLECARILRRDTQGASFRFETRLVNGEMAFLEWGTEGEGPRIEDGADSFLIRDGKIVVQTIHYRVEQR